MLCYVYALCGCTGVGVSVVTSLSGFSRCGMLQCRPRPRSRHLFRVVDVWNVSPALVGYGGLCLPLLWRLWCRCYGFSDQAALIEYTSQGSPVAVV
ncbi:hypothetical protein BJX96DRAFT_38951 [Aspergillus floccosus]